MESKCLDTKHEAMEQLTLSTVLNEEGNGMKREKLLLF